MVGEKSPEFASGNIVYGLKMSRLNYIVKETPYSLYITVRKKFIKDEPEDQNSDNVRIEEKSDVEKNVKGVENENLMLKKKVDDLGRSYAMLKYENEELDIKLEQLEKEKLSLGDKLDDAYSETRDIQKKMDVTSQAMIDTVKESERLSKSFEKGKICDDKNVMIINELEENIMMLENVVEQRDSEIYSLKKKLSALEESADNFVECKKCGSDSENEETTSIKSKFKCESCDFSGNSLGELKLHTANVHSFTCDLCDFETPDEKEIQPHRLETHTVVCEHCSETFIGQRKLEKHTCKIHIQNPEYGDLYMKNWIKRDICFHVYSNNKKQELAVLHSTSCWEDSKFCSEIPPNFKASEKSIIDPGGLIHMPAVKSKFLKENGIISWLPLRLEVNKINEC